MPFKLDDGEDYFEAVECVKTAIREIPENWLALCPICAAKYRHANASTPEEIRRLLFSAEDQELQEILVRLARKSETIQFKAKHMLDIVTDLKADAAEAPPPDSSASPPTKSGG